MSSMITAIPKVPYNIGQKELIGSKMEAQPQSFAPRKNGEQNASNGKTN